MIFGDIVKNFYKTGQLNLNNFLNNLIFDINFADFVYDSKL